MKNKKLVSKKIISKKVTLKKVKKVEIKKAESFLKPQKSISRLVFNFIVENNLLESDNRKEKYEELLSLVKKDFPSSKFQKTHFFWYLSRANKQKQNGLELTHLVSIPKEVAETK